MAAGYKHTEDNLKVMQSLPLDIKIRNSPSFVAKCMLSVGKGRKEWGAETGKE